MRTFPLRLSTVLVLANAAFWCAFAAFFIANSQHYEPHRPTFEEDSPNIIYFGRSLSYLVNDQMRPAIRALRIVQCPSFYAASPINYYFSSRNVTIAQLYGGISVGGYYILAVFLLSFAQWFFIGVFVDYIRHFSWGSPATETEGTCLTKSAVSSTHRSEFFLFAAHSGESAAALVR
jgi:hypothetical protein